MMLTFNKIRVLKKMTEEFTMVKTLTYYECEFCNFNYSTFDKAVNCESKGLESPLAKIGDRVEYFKKGIEGWDGSDLHLTDLVIMDIKQNKYRPHNLEYILGYKSDSGEIIEDIHASVESNDEFLEYCIIK